MVPQRGDWEWRGLAAAAPAAAWFLANGGSQLHWLMLYFGAVVASGLIGALAGRRWLRVTALALCTLLWSPVVLYLGVLLPVAGAVLLVAPVSAAWGVARAARGRPGVPHPLA